MLNVNQNQFYVLLVINLSIFVTLGCGGTGSRYNDSAHQTYQKQSNPTYAQMKVQFTNDTSYILQQRTRSPRYQSLNAPTGSLYDLYHRGSSQFSESEVIRSTYNSGSNENQSRHQDPRNFAEKGKGDEQLQQLREAYEEVADANINTLMIRVRLAPILKSFKNDVYRKSSDIFKIGNKNGLKIRVFDPLDSSFSGEVRTGFFLEVDRQQSLFVLDGQRIVIHPKMNILVEPINLNDACSVFLNIDQRILSQYKINSEISGESGGIKYRGKFLIKTYSDKDTHQVDQKISWEIINLLDLETYLKAVVASEIQDKYPNEAIRAQAVAARTYALRHVAVARCLGVKSSCRALSWDVDPSTQYQNYLGAQIEKPRINEAVSSTSGLFLSYRGQPILAMFHASSGGKLKGAKDILCKNISNTKGCGEKSLKEFPYLVEKIDLYNGNFKRYGHGLGLPQRSAQNMAQNGFNATQILDQFYPGTLLLSLKDDSAKENMISM